mgnify:CR=1 FL=1
MSGFLDDEMVKDALKSGCLHMLNKPIMPDRLFDKIDDIFKEEKQA